MVDSAVPKAGIVPAPPRVVLGRERLLGVTEIRELTGLGGGCRRIAHERERSLPQAS